MSEVRADRENDTPWLWIVGYTVFAIALRVFPRYVATGDEIKWLWNFTAVGALGLFAGARLRSTAAYVVPLLAMLVADLLLIWPLSQLNPPQPAFYALTPVVYGCYLFNVLLGRLLDKTSLPGFAVPILGPLTTATVFFVVTNFGEWALTEFYTKDLAGLTKCFVLAAPFFKNTLAGDMVYSFLFFGLHAAYVIVAQRQKASQPA